MCESRRKWTRNVIAKQQQDVFLQPPLLFFYPMATTNRQKAGKTLYYIRVQYNYGSFSTVAEGEEMWLGQDDLHGESGALNGMTGAAQNAVNLPFYPLRIRNMLLVWNL